MKSYKQLFYEANKKAFKRYNFYKHIKFTIGMLFILSLIGPSEYDNFLIILSGIFLFLFVVFVFISRKYTNEYFEKEAQKFATTIYMEDMIIALQKAFIVSEEFRFELKASIASYSHYDEGFDPSGASIETYENSEKLITHSGKEYYLTGWDYDTYFRFYLCEVGDEKILNTDNFYIATNVIL